MSKLGLATSAMQRPSTRVILSASLDRPAWLSGLSFVGLTHLVAPLVAMLILGSNAKPDKDTTQREISTPVIAARFARLGKKPDPHQLPNRDVPQLKTAPTDAVPVSDKAQERPPEPKTKPERDPDAVDDALKRLGDRAQAFAERNKQREREGDPEGIEEGSEKKSSEGNIYAGKLYAFFRRHWSVPSTLNSDQVKALQTTVLVGINAERQVLSIEVAKSSGNPLFDRSVQEAITRIIEGGLKVPAPPESIASDYLGKRVPMRFLGRHAR